MNEIVMSHPHDAVQRLNPAEVNLITQDVSSIVRDAVKHKDPETAFRYGENLNRTGQAVWVAMAHLIYEMEKVWGTEEMPSDDPFIKVAASRWNKSQSTITRHLEIWKYVIEKPEHTHARLAALYTKPMQGLWYIKQAAKLGELTDDDWDAIELAPDIKTLREIGKGVRGEFGKAKNALKIMIEDDGTLKARRAGHYKVVGHLNIHDDDAVIVAACERIRNESGIFDR